MSAYSATDKELKRMEKYLAEQYEIADKEIQKKALKYFERFYAMDEEKKKLVEEGKLSQEEYDRWRTNKIMFGDHWTRLSRNIQQELANVNQTALDYINGKVPDIFSVHYNDVMEQSSKASIGINFEMINGDTVRKLATSKKLMLPPKKGLDKTKDMLWNKKKINSAVLQGILQGSSMKDIAKSLEQVSNMNKKAAIRNARTMVTCAENAGRQEGMNRAEKEGIKFKKLWIATLDGGTRDTHMGLNGQTVENYEFFHSKSGAYLEYPGDWRAPAKEVYNCRCSLGSIVTGFRKLHPEREVPQARNRAEAYKLLTDNVGFKTASKTLDQIDERLLVSAANQLALLEDRFNVVHKSKSDIYAMNHGTANAYVESVTSKPDVQSLSLCPRAFSNYENYVIMKKKAIEIGWSASCTPDNVQIQTVTHEFGHILENILFKEEFDKHSVNESDAKRERKIIAKNIMKEITDIAKQYNPDFSKSKNLSLYGKTNNFEAFAECFANSQLGDANELGHAMNIWLKRKGLMKYET